MGPKLIFRERKDIRNETAKSIHWIVTSEDSSDRGEENFSFSLKIASRTSCLCTETSLGASIPILTLSPRTSTTVITMLSLTTMLSFFFRDNTSMGFLPTAKPPVRNSLLSPDNDKNVTSCRSKYYETHVQTSNSFRQFLPLIPKNGLTHRELAIPLQRKAAQFSLLSQNHPKFLTAVPAYSVPTFQSIGSGYRKTLPSKFRRRISSPSRPMTVSGCSGILPPPPGASIT